MEQKSNVEYRAEKEYKNSREKFFLLLREIISNAIHAVLIRNSKEEYYLPVLFKQWFIETFFPFIISNETLVANISLNGDSVTIKKNSIEAETKKELFEIRLSDDNIYSFTLWLIKNSNPMHGNNPIICFARNLRANLSNGSLSYSIDNNDGYTLYLTSDFFDEYVDTKGERIDISYDDIISIQQKIDEILDERFKAVIENNQKASKRNLKNFQKKYPSLEAFVVESNIIGDKNIVNEGEIIQAAINEKSRIEKKFWNQIDKDPRSEEDERFSDSEECHKLLNSSLHIYVKHRESILKRLHVLIQKFDEAGEDKPELESTVHELFINRGTTLKDSSNINHLHNLWILDDKFTTFSNDFKAKSTKSGQSLSDIYIWADDPEKVKQILIFELKSTTKAHNAGQKEESMIAQVKRYAQDFYKNPTKTLNWDVDTDQVQYTGIILSRKSDIYKELTSLNTGGNNFKRIPFLQASFYHDDSFPKGDNPDYKINIRIELYSFEDIYELAANRNEVFFKLLKKEFELDQNND